VTWPYPDRKHNRCDRPFCTNQANEAELVLERAAEDYRIYINTHLHAIMIDRSIRARWLCRKSNARTFRQDISITFLRACCIRALADGVNRELSLWYTVSTEATRPWLYGRRSCMEILAPTLAARLIV